MEIVFLLAVIVLASVSGLQSYFLYKINQDLVEKIKEEKKEFIIPFPENPEAAVKDPDMVPMEEVPDKEVGEAIGKMFE